MPLKREELIRRLKELAQSEPPKNLSPGAMCYSPMYDDRIIVRIPCELCGKGRVHLILDPGHPFLQEYHYLLDELVDRQKRTLDESLENIFYSRCKQDTSYFDNTRPDNPHGKIIESYQSRLNLINQAGLAASFEIPDHCEKCGHGIEDQPFHLVIRFANEQKPHRVKIRTLDELNYFTLFVQNKDRHKADNDWETALQTFVPEILPFVAEATIPFLCDLFGIESECNELKDVTQWRQIKKLTLNSPAVSISWLNLITTMTQLEELDLSDCTGIRNDCQVGLSLLGKMPQLKILRLNRCSKLNNIDFGFLPSLKKLEVLSVSGHPKMHGETMKMIGSISSLKELDISHGGLIFDSALRFLIPLQHLHTLNIVGCDNLTVDSVKHLHDMPNLRHLQADDEIKAAYENSRHHD